MESSKEINLYSQICQSWYFYNKKKAIFKVAEILTEKGYKVNCNVEPVATSQIYNLSVVIGNKSRIVFSNNIGDKKQGAIYSKNPSLVLEELVNKIISVIQ